MDVIGNPAAGDHVLVTTQGNVVRSAIFLGVVPGPADPDRQGVLVSLAADQKVLEWVDTEYVKKLEVTFTGGDRR